MAVGMERMGVRGEDCADSESGFLNYTVSRKVKVVRTTIIHS
jgi:hypothetical protein